MTVDAKKSTRVQLDLPPSAYERLGRLKEATEATSYAEVCKNALRVYQSLVERKERGEQIYYKNSDGVMVELILLA